jgi:H+/Cl- antiporter ClcA
VRGKVRARLRKPRQLFVEGLLGAQRRLLAYVVVAGLVGGLVGAAYIALLHLFQEVLWPTHWDTLPHLFVLVGVGLAVGVLTRILGNPGDVELLVNNIHVSGGPQDIRDLRSLIPVSLLCISAGGAMGPEAPLVQTTGSLGAWLANRSNLQRDEIRVLTITGMAAGFTVLFGAPLGSAVFALEILHRRGMEYYEALMPAVLGSLVGYALYVVLTGVGVEPVWRFPSLGRLEPVDIAWGSVADSPRIMSVKKIPIESTMAEFWKVAIMPAPTPRRSDGRLFMIPVWLGEANRPIANPTSNSSDANQT